MQVLLLGCNWLLEKVATLAKRGLHKMGLAVHTSAQDREVCKNRRQPYTLTRLHHTFMCAVTRFQTQIHFFSKFNDGV